MSCLTQNKWMRGVQLKILSEFRINKNQLKPKYAYVRKDVMLIINKNCPQYLTASSERWIINLWIMFIACSLVGRLLMGMFKVSMSSHSHHIIKYSSRVIWKCSFSDSFFFSCVWQKGFLISISCSKTYGQQHEGAEEEEIRDRQKDQKQTEMAFWGGHLLVEFSVFCVT